MTSTTAKKMHVLQIVGDPVGGIRKHVHSVINGLDANQFIQSYAYSTTSQDEHFRREIGALQERLVGVVALRIRKKPHPSDLWNLVKLIRFCRKNRVSVVHGHGAKGGMYARIVALVCRLPAFYTPHGGVAHSMFGYWEDKLYTLVEKLLASFTYCYIFESKYTAESFQAKVGMHSRPWIVNYNGIVCSAPPLLQIQKIVEARNETNVGVFAMLRREKGQIHLINAIAAILKTENANIRLHIFGDGTDRESLETRVRVLGITGNVTFHGDVADPESKMAMMDIIVIPSLFESFGYVGLEAMASGKPVIASAVGGLKEIFSAETAWLVPPGEETALGEALVRCVRNPDLAEKMAREGFEQCMIRFSLNKMIENLSFQYRNAWINR